MRTSPPRFEQVNLATANLLAGVPEDELQRSEEEKAQWLLANLLDWNRREAKSTWWEYYRLRDLSDSDCKRTRMQWAG